MSTMGKSSKPYLVRAIHSWCINNELTPHLLVGMGFDGTEVPPEYAEEGQIVFNVSQKATRDLKIDNDAIIFLANFGHRVVTIRLPMDAVIAIYAYENGEGITFDEDDQIEGVGGVADYVGIDEDIGESSGGRNQSMAPMLSADKKPTLTIIK
jgi:stringent starvation protein B